jgi:sialidase-1
MNLKTALAMKENVPEGSFLEQKDLFIGGHDSVNTYRIPALITTQKGTLLAFCEAREGNDQTPTDLVMKRSSNCGETWSPMQVVAHGKQPGAVAMMNPTPVLDQTDGTIILLYNSFPGLEVEGEYTTQFIPGVVRQLVTKSTDDGTTWTTPEDVTEQVSEPTWSCLCVGPGVGIQTASGRLVVPWFHSRHADVTIAGAIYSDDHGTTWRCGETVEEPGSECQVVELVDGSLMLNIRAESYREVAISTDGGETWLEKYQDRALIEPICQASILRYSKKEDGFAKDRILFCNPAHDSKRENMTVRMSYDEAKTWPVAKQIRAEWCAGYTCLTLLKDGTIGLLYESATYGRDTICFARFSLDWLTDGEDVLS